jgi:nucleotide-binding universal stress UspA family protein
MSTKREILAACDLSEYSLPVLKMAGRMAQDTHRKLIVAHVIHHRDIDSVAYAIQMPGLFNQAPTPQEFVDKLSKERSWLIQSLIRKADANHYLSKIEILVGHPFESLMKLIQSRDVYMVVIGNKGRGNIAGLLAGSTAQRMLSQCPVPFLCVPDPAHHLQGGKASDDG